MALGAPILSPQRMRMHDLAMFAAWESVEAIEDFLNRTKLGQKMAAGWHLRMSFLRRWGLVRELNFLAEGSEDTDPNAVVSAFTLARMKLPEVPRFIRWGRPVETLIRDHPQKSFAMAAIRYPQSIATFSIWNTQQAMTDMVKGHSPVANPTRHVDAMQERDRRDFHHEFTTLRFKPEAEFGSWEGRNSLLPSGALA